jgi:hypothetical protein
MAAPLGVGIPQFAAFRRKRGMPAQRNRLMHLWQYLSPVALSKSCIMAVLHSTRIARTRRHSTMWRSLSLEPLARFVTGGAGARPGHPITGSGASAFAVMHNFNDGDEAAHLWLH